MQKNWNLFHIIIIIIIIMFPFLLTQNKQNQRGVRGGAGRSRPDGQPRPQ